MELIDKLKEQIALELEYCDSDNTPFVCGQVSTQEGYKKIESLIIDLVCGDAFSINDAIIQIEKTYNINKID